MTFVHESMVVARIYPCDRGREKNPRPQLQLPDDQPVRLFVIGFNSLTVVGRYLWELIILSMQ